MPSRQKPQSILFNSVQMAEGLIDQMPSAELLESDKAFFAHTLGIHAVLSRLRRPGTWLEERLGIVGDQPKDLLWLFGDGRLNEVQYLLNDIWSSNNKEIWPFVSQVHELYSGGFRFDRAEIIRALKLKLYSYILFRIHHKGFQQYPKQLQAIIPKDLEPSIEAFEQALQDAATRDEFLRQIKSSER
jgi:hypothetical protein